MKTLLCALAAAALGMFAPPAHAALLDCGGGLICDPALEVTWLWDANHPQTTGASVDGALDGNEALAFASQLDFAGLDDWRLPERWELQLQLYGTEGVSAAQPGPFADLQDGWYWTATSAATTAGAHQVHMGSGADRVATLDQSGYLLLLRDGLPGVQSERAPVPVGEEVQVFFGSSGVQMTFGRVTVAGEASLSPLLDPPPPPAGYARIGPGLDLGTTAAFDPVPGVTVAVPWCGHCMPAWVPWCGHCSVAELAPHLQLRHHDGAHWGDETTGVEITSGRVVGEAGFLSPFAVMLLMDPVEALEALIAQVSELGLPRGLETSLLAKLQGALAAWTDGGRGRMGSAAHRLGAFVHACEAQRGKQLSSEVADDLIAAAEAIARTAPD
jgi:hypothetical protein